MRWPRASRRGWKMPRMKLAIVASAVWALAACSTKQSTTDIGEIVVAAVGAVGDQVGPVLDIPAAAHCSISPGQINPIGTSLAVVPASAIDETLEVPLLIVTSCYHTGPEKNNIYLINPHPPITPTNP